MLLVVLLGYITATLLPGGAAVAVRIRAYNATAELSIRRDPFTLGTRVLLTCDVTGISEGNEAVSYRWYHKCPEIPNPRCEIRDEDPYYRVVSDTLLVDVTSWNQGGRYYCTVHGLQETQTAISPNLSVAGNPAPFLYTTTSLLPEYSVLTDVQQATGRNGQKWIVCSSGGQGTVPQIWIGSELVANSSTANSVTIGLGTQRPNGLYHCLSEQSQRKYFLLYLCNSATLPAPTVSPRDSSMWTLTSADGSQVERYIVEFKCRVRNMTFVERYMSVSASGGTERVATSGSCFGGLGQLHRVKVWAVSGPNISPALVCTTDGQCKEEGNSTCEAATTPTTVGGCRPCTTTIFPTPGSTPSGSSTGELPTIGIVIGVVVGSSILLAFFILVVIILVVVAATVKRKATCEQTRDMAMEEPYYSTIGVKAQMEMTEQGADAPYEYAQGSTGAIVDGEKIHSADHHYEYAHGSESVEKQKSQGADAHYEYAHGSESVEEQKSQGAEAHYEYADRSEKVHEDKVEEDGAFADDLHMYEVIDMELSIKITRVTPKTSSAPACATNTPEYSVVDNSKKGVPKKVGNGSTIENNDQYAMPMSKMDKMTNEREGLVGSGGNDEEQYDDTLELGYEPKADSEPGTVE